MLLKDIAHLRDLDGHICSANFRPVNNAKSTFADHILVINQGLDGKCNELLHFQIKIRFVSFQALALNYRKH
jgi:hypothetical protein